MKFRCKYEYSSLYGRPHHVWTVVGRDGAVHLHVSDLGEQWSSQHGQRYSGGLEVHYRHPQGDEAPSQEKCWLLGGPCWHDGTTMYAEETLIPLWQRAPHDHERMFGILQDDYAERFRKE